MNPGPDQGRMFSAEEANPSYAAYKENRKRIFGGQPVNWHFAVDVDWVHDHESLKAGRTVDSTSRVHVMAGDQNEAHLLATQMVAARGVMPTASRNAQTRRQLRMDPTDTRKIL